MTTSGYPSSFDEIRAWGHRNGVTDSEARLRFAQYGILQAVGRSRALRQVLVFKGGNALDFVWQPNRSTRDLDFSLDASLGDPNETREFLQERLERSLEGTGRALNISFAVQTMKQQPPGDDKTFITYVATIGYALQDELRVIRHIERGMPVAQIVPVEISVNEDICESHDIQIVEGLTLRVSSLEDILAEKLRALLQQPIRNRLRKQDLLDIAVCLQHHGIDAVDCANIGEYLIRKASIRDVRVSRAAFYDEDIVRRARLDYDTLSDTTRTVFIPFDEALTLLHQLVERLSIPE